MMSLIKVAKKGPTENFEIVDKFSHAHGID